MTDYELDDDDELEDDWGRDRPESEPGCSFEELMRREGGYETPAPSAPSTAPPEPQPIIIDDDDAIRCWDAYERGEKWINPRNGEQCEGKPLRYGVRDPRKPTVPPQSSHPGPTGANFAAASGTVTIPTPRARNRDRSSAYHWTDERHGNYMRIPKLMMADDALTKDDVGVYFALSNMEPGTLVCWPSLRELAEGIGFTVQQVRTHLDHLIKAGYLAMEPWANARGDNESSCLILYPRCHEYERDELSALRVGGHPDGRRETKGPGTHPLVRLHADDLVSTHPQ